MEVVILLWRITLFADNLLPIALAWFYPKYKPKEMALSVLGSRQSPLKWVYNIWCIFSGVFFCIAPTLYCENKSGLTIAIWTLLAVYGIGCEIMSGIFPLNEDWNEQDVITKIHGGASAVGLTALLFAPLLMAVFQFQANSTITGIITFVCFTMAFVFFCFFIMGEKPRFANTVLRNGGLWQRLVLASCYIPLAIWCITM